MRDPRLSTPRLTLRPPGADDAPALAAYFIRNATRFERWDPPRSRDVAAYERWIADVRAASLSDGYASQFVAIAAGSEAPIATVGIASLDRSEPGATISYTLDAASEGQGYASEAVAAVTTFAFEHLALRSIYAYVDMENVRSAALLRRLTFVEVARLPPLPGPAGSLRTQVLWRLARREVP